MAWENLTFMGVKKRKVNSSQRAWKEVCEHRRRIEVYRACGNVWRYKGDILESQRAWEEACRHEKQV